jgi:hypothetical protein
MQLVRACRAYAALDGRDYVIPDDVQALAVPVLAHRLLPSFEAEQTVADLVERLPLPGERDLRRRSRRLLTQVDGSATFCTSTGAGGFK